jgi:DNA polymerase
MPLAGTIFRAGLRTSTVRPDWDFETYSEAGYVWDIASNKWTCLPNASQGKKGLFVVGAALYAEHHTAELICLAYDLKDGLGRRRWRPGMPLPADLVAHIQNGGELEAHNAPFEAWIHSGVLTKKYGFPPMRPEQFYCSQAKCRAWALPPSLEMVGDVLNISAKKDKDGKRLMDKFSMPRNPTKADPRLRILPSDDPEDAERYYAYNERDIEAEAEVSARVPDLSPIERQYWLVDFAINRRGIHVDRAGVENCIAIIEQAHERYNAELARITGGIVQKASEVQKTVGFLGGLKLYTDSLDDEAVSGWLKRIDDAEKADTAFKAWSRGEGHFTEMPDDPGLRYEAVFAITNLPLAKRILEIRAEVGSASVKKVFAMRNRLSQADRIHDLFVFHGARTGRPTGDGPQSTNLPNSGPDVHKCDSCHRWFPKAIGWCVACGGQPAFRCAVKDGCKQFLPRGQMTCCGAPHGPKPFVTEWHAEAAECALEAIASRSLEYVEACWGNAMAAVSGVLRGLFNAAEGHDLICSDYSAIEAVVNAAISGVEWRMEVFRGKGKIYEASAAKTFKIPEAEILEYPDKHGGQKHPLRQKGKVTELALGYLGWIGALRAMGFEGSDKEAKDLILAWRDASPEIVFHGGGQSVPRGKLGKHPIFGGRREGEAFYYGLEGMAVAAIQNPGKRFDVVRLDGQLSPLHFICHEDVLYMVGPDGTNIPYHRPRLTQSDKPWRGLSISFEGYNTNPKSGPFGWIRMFTYAGKLQENACQFLANRILRHGQVLLEAAGYPIVQHVYDENCSEVREGFGSVEQYEAIMAIMPPWARTPDGKPWPIRASGGWRGKRYRK